MGKTKPWKPYDVEQAKADIMAEGDHLATQLTNRVNRATDEAVKRLETEAATFAKMPADVASLFTSAQHVAVDTLDLTDMVRDGKAVELRSAELYFHNAGQRRLFDARGGYGPVLPPKKYSVLTFFIPEED